MLQASRSTSGVSPVGKSGEQRLYREDPAWTLVETTQQGHGSMIHEAAFQGRLFHCSRVLLEALRHFQGRDGNPRNATSGFDSRVGCGHALRVLVQLHILQVIPSCLSMFAFCFI